MEGAFLMIYRTSEGGFSSVVASELAACSVWVRQWTIVDIRDSPRGHIDKSLESLAIIEQCLKFAQNRPLAHTLLVMAVSLFPACLACDIRQSGT